MFDVFTYFVYLSLLFTLLFVLKVSSNLRGNALYIEKINKLNIGHFIAILAISFVVGFRYKVGVDWEGYVKDFFLIQNKEFDEQRVEYGFYIINKIIGGAGLGYEWMFFTVAFITWYFYFKSVQSFILPIFIFFIFADEYFFWSMNGVRQFAAMGIWLVSIKYIIKKKLVNYLLLIIVASLFHTSVLLLIPFYFIPYGKTYNKWLWITLLFVSFFIGNNHIFIEYTEKALYFLSEKSEVIDRYTHYVDDDRLFFTEEAVLGLGFFFKFLIHLLIMLVGNIFLKKYPKLNVYFILVFIGAILLNLSYNVQLVRRINNYFIILRPLVLSILVWYFWKMKNYRPFVVILCLLYFFLFLVTIYNSSNMCSPFNFTF